ncbi:hypothetical protein NERG_02324 [Nematocida ausubeli]|uniref:Uncharacterized protein n=1 Tax=Nematocida ausubeli (strain ATCC PRA-371 / ERTm2) TaxID=1913371 RepID=H8ZFF3_NEMA1|nr:hypothetical protein NERG_02324 [Nematocida ausubeli]
MGLIDINESNMIAGPSNGSDMRVTVENPQELAEQQSDIKSDLPKTSADANDWWMEAPSENETLLPGTEKTDLNNESVLSKTMNVLKDKANGICSAFDDIEEVCVKAAAETMSAVGLSRMESSYGYIENKPMQEPIVEENSQPLRHTHVDASNGAPAWIGTEPPTKPLIIAHTVPFLIVTAILLRLSIYSTTMGFGLVIKYLKNTAAFNLFKVNAGLIGLIGIFLVKNTTNILLTTAKDIWNRKAKGSAICAAVIVLYTTVVVGSGLLGPLTLNVQELEVSLYWIVIFALTTWAFVKYDRDLREEIEEEEYSSDNFKKVDRSTFIVCFCCFSTTLITLFFYGMHAIIKYVAPVKVHTL